MAYHEPAAWQPPRAVDVGVRGGEDAALPQRRSIMQARRRAFPALTFILAAGFSLAAPLVFTSRAHAQDEEGEGGEEGGGDAQIIELNKKAVEALTAKKYDEGIEAL